MKKILIVVVTGLMAACNQNDAKAPVARNGDSATMSATPITPVTDSSKFTTIQWLDSIKQDLGTISEGQTPEITWRFKNTGDQPLIIENASASCGCTIAEKPEQPVMPGEESFIKAKFNSEGKAGPNTKQVFVTANTKGTKQQELQFAVIVNSKNK